MSLTLSEMESINPMITSDGDTFRVSSALTALADLLSDDQMTPPDGARDYGLSVILQTCAAALRRMGEVAK
jgi:hypothetical protein